MLQPQLFYKITLPLHPKVIWDTAGLLPKPVFKVWNTVLKDRKFLSSKTEMSLTNPGQIM